MKIITKALASLALVAAVDAFSRLNPPETTGTGNEGGQDLVEQGEQEAPGLIEQGEEPQDLMEQGDDVQDYFEQGENGDNVAPANNNDGNWNKRQQGNLRRLSSSSRSSKSAGYGYYTYGGKGKGGYWSGYGGKGKGGYLQSTGKGYYAVGKGKGPSKSSSQW